MKNIFFIVVFLGLIKNLNSQTEQELLVNAKFNLDAGNNAEVIQICTNILATNNNNEVAYLYKADAQMNILRFDNALEDINKVIAINPKNAKAYTLKGRIKLRQYDFKSKDIEYCNEAKANFDLAMKLNPNDAITLNNLAYYYQYCIGDIKAAKEQYDKSLTIDNSQSDVFYSRGNLKGDLHDSIGAINDYTSAIKLNPKKGAYYIERAKIYEGLGNYKKSFDDNNTAIISDSSALGFIGRGRTALRLKQYDAAINDFTYIISKTQLAESNNYTSIFSYDCAGAYYYRGYCYLNLNDKINACNDWENALYRGLKLANNLIELHCKMNPNIYLNRGQTKYDNEDYNGALENLNLYLSIKPNSEEAILLRAHCKYMLKDYLGAIDDYNTCLNFNAKNIDAIFYRASSYNELGNYNAAIESYSMCINLNPKYTEAYYYRGQCYDNLKDYKNALLDYNKVIALNPKMFENEIYFNRALVKTGLSDDIGAIDDYKKALIYDSKNAAIYINRGQLKFSLKDYNGALSDYNSALNIEPSFGMVYYYRGLTYFELHNNKNACEDLKVANDAGVQLAGIKLSEICK